jgi:hypothetical protein
MLAKAEEVIRGGGSNILFLSWIPCNATAKTGNGITGRKKGL